MMYIANEPYAAPDSNGAISAATQALLEMAQACLGVALKLVATGDGILRLVIAGTGEAVMTIGVDGGAVTSIPWAKGGYGDLACAIMARFVRSPWDSSWELVNYPAHGKIYNGITAKVSTLPVSGGRAFMEMRPSPCMGASFLVLYDAWNNEIGRLAIRGGVVASVESGNPGVRDVLRRWIGAAVLERAA